MEDLNYRFCPTCDAPVEPDVPLLEDPGVPTELEPESQDAAVLLSDTDILNLLADRWEYFTTRLPQVLVLCRTLPDASKRISFRKAIIKLFYKR